METVEIIAENEVTSQNLSVVFKRAFLSTTLDSDGDLFVATESLRRVRVVVDEDRKLLGYRAIFGVKEHVPLELKHAFVNKMNDAVVFVRFCIPEDRPDILWADYFIPFEEGIPAFQIVSALRLFARVTTRSIRRFDDEDLVE